MRNSFNIILLLSVLFTSGCATLSREECTQGSWYDLGLEDGRSGNTYKRLGNHQKACSEYGIVLDSDQYSKGRKQGLKDYCTLDNAIDMGLKGERYKSVCPSEVHSKFQRYNRAAYNVYQSKEKLEKVDQELYQKENQLLDSKLTDEKRSKIRNKIRRLDRERQKIKDDVYSNERKLDKLR